MIVYWDAHQFPGLDELTSDADIFTAWLQIPRRMVVRQDDRGSVCEDRHLKDLTRLDDGRSQTADADLRDPDHRVGRVKKHNNELLPIFVMVVFLQDVCDFLGRLDLLPVGEGKVGFSNESGGVEGHVAEETALVVKRARTCFRSFGHGPFRYMV